MDVKQAVQDQFGAAAAAYAVSEVHAGGIDLQAMLAAAALRGHERVLDVGCGAGHTALAFARAAREVHGLDLTEAMLVQADGLARACGIRNLRLRRGDVEALPYPDRHFDVVTSRLCAHHFVHPIVALAEMARVLRPGGLLLHSDSVSPEDSEQDHFLDTIERLRDPSHVRNHTVEQWCAGMASVGLEAVVLGSWQIEIDFDDWVARMRTPPEAVREIREVMDRACPTLREAFRIGATRPYSFDIPIALLRGRRAADARHPLP